MLFASPRRMDSVFMAAKADHARARASIAIIIFFIRLPFVAVIQLKQKEL